VTFKPADWPNIEPRPRWVSETEVRLGWCHGPERAAAIIEGRDPATEADLAAWRTLGQSTRKP
jgi:hypothetical protein